MNKDIFKKIITGTLLISFFIPQVTLAQGAAVAAAGRAVPGLPVTDEGAKNVATGGVINSEISKSTDILKILKDYGLDQVAYTLAQSLGQKLANKVINKAKGGASGDSSQDSYIKNYGEFFANVGAQSLDKYVSTLEISDNPYAESIARSLVRDAGNYARNAASTGDPLGGFNLDRTIGPNWKEFSTNASVGGWDGILALSNPINTNVGASMIAQEALQDQIENTKASEALKLTASGIKPQGKCNMNIGQYKDKIQSIKANKNLIQDNNTGIKEIKAAINNSEMTAEETAQYLSENPEINDLASLQKSIEGDLGITAAQQQNQSAGLQIGADVKGLVEDYGGCISELISNPNALVTEGLQEATKYGLTQTQKIQGWGQIVAGVFIQLFSTFVQTGLSSLGANFQSPKSIGGPEQLIGKNGQAVPWSKAPTVIVDLKGGFQLAQNNTQTEIDLLQKYTQVITDEAVGTGGTLLDNMSALDQCLPGPDFRYESRLSPYYTAKISKTQRKKDKGNDGRKETKSDALSNVDASISVAASEMSIWTQDPTRNIPGGSIMQQHISLLTGIRKKYKQKKEQLLEKQSALSLTYDVESKLNVNIQFLKPFIPTLPTQVAFTTRAWDRLPAAQQTALYNWAKTITATEGNTTDPKLRRDLAIAAVWDVWSNPDNYILNKDGWNRVDAATGLSRSAEFLNGSQYMKTRGMAGKNEIRGQFNSMADRLSIDRTVEQANLDLEEIKNTAKVTADLLADCYKIKSIIQTNPPRGTPDQVNQNMLATLKSRQAELKSDTIRQALELPSILTDVYGKFPSNMVNCGPLHCKQDAGLILGDEDAPDQETWYQVEPAKSAWELVGQPMALCGLNQYVSRYKNYLDSPTLDGGKPIECSPDWYVSTKKDIVQYFYGEQLY